jgi:hypothetical protein
MQDGPPTAASQSLMLLQIRTPPYFRRLDGSADLRLTILTSGSRFRQLPPEGWVFGYCIHFLQSLFTA